MADVVVANMVQTRRANHVVRNKILLEGVECCKDTQMKAYDITKLTAELNKKLSCRRETARRFVSLNI